MSRTTLIMSAAGVCLTLGSAASAVDIDTVPVGNPGNPDDPSCNPSVGYGGVAYEFNIGKYEVTSAQYCEFLNAVDPDGTDPHDLYNSNMGSGWGGITFAAENPNGSKYEVRQIYPGRGNMPINYVSFWDACRFANWLHNGRGNGDTESGAYTLTSEGIANNTVARNPDWTWAVCSEDEWYKAAYYDGDAGVYYHYPTGCDIAPTPEWPPGNTTIGSANCAGADSPGDLTAVGAYTAKPSDSPYGTFDQGGNVEEWNEAIIVTSCRGFRGGSLYSPVYWLATEMGVRIGYSPSRERQSIGFRVSEVPEPATILIVTTAGLPMLLKRRRNA